MDFPLFQIRNLECSYDQGNDISLVIEKFDIPSGKVVFLLGASGAGKSTLLETLGLMNNTIHRGEVLFYPEKNKAPLNLGSLWASNDMLAITELRRKYFSFIFQNTNLMENFTAYENVCLSGMIKQDLSQEKVLPGAKSMMNIVKLPESEVSLSTMASNLSGGQRQRLAFVRALNTDATILFCDEPTGNLDEVNAGELMAVISSFVDADKSAIIVSHDIDLALKYADMIVIISKDPAKGFGEILIDTIYQKRDWESKSETEKRDFAFQIRNHFLSGKVGIVNKEQQAEKINTSITYRKLFFLKEGKILAGKKKSSLFILSIIIFFTFLAVGFANGSLDYLDKKMNSAFVNWVNIPIPFMKSDESVQNLQTILEKAETRVQFSYHTITPYLKNPITVFDNKTGKIYYVPGRTVDIKRDHKLLYEFVLDKKNRTKGATTGFKNEEDKWLIVTERLLQELHYPLNTDFIYFQNDIYDTMLPKGKQLVKMRIPIPIRTIVKALPGKYDFLYTLNFYNCIKKDRGEVFSTISETKYLYGFLETSHKKDKKAIEKGIQKFIAHYQWPTGLPDSLKPGITYYVTQDTPAINPGLKLEMDFTPNAPNHTYLDTFWNRLLKSAEMRPYKENIIRTIDLNLAHPDMEFAEYDQISVYFRNLDKIRDFAKYIYNMEDPVTGERSKIEIDETTITEKENFNFLSKVTWIISILLIIFCTVAISLFIFNLLKMHLMKVKMNLGTFKAIGMGDQETRNIYFSIILSFIALSAIIAFGSAAIAGWLIDIYLVSVFQVEDGIRYFKIFDWITLVTFVVIVITAILVSWFTINRIISKSPGDLIYNR